MAVSRRATDASARVISRVPLPEMSHGKAAKRLVSHVNRPMAGTYPISPTRFTYEGIHAMSRHANLSPAAVAASNMYGNLSYVPRHAVDPMSGMQAVSDAKDVAYGVGRVIRPPAPARLGLFANRPVI
jgi:hypothetical protein